jgi:hypothetical protein
LGLRFSVEDFAGFRVGVLGFEVRVLGFRVLGFRVKNLETRVDISRLRSKG